MGLESGEGGYEEGGEGRERGEVGHGVDVVEVFYSIFSLRVLLAIASRKKKGVSTTGFAFDFFGLVWLVRGEIPCGYALVGLFFNADVLAQAYGLFFFNNNDGRPRAGGVIYII